LLILQENNFLYGFALAQVRYEARARQICLRSV